MQVNFSASGYWTFEDDITQYHGDLYLNRDAGGIVIYIRIPNHGAPKGYLQLPIEIPLIKGTTINGAKITLIDCSRISTQSKVGTEDIYGYQAKYMIEGVSFDHKENVVFSKIKLSIPKIIEWGNVSNYIMPDAGKDNVLIELKNVNPIEIYTCEEYTLSYYLTYNYPLFNLMKEKIVLEQTPYLTVESESLHTLNWFIDIVMKMKRIIEIAIGLPLEFNKMIAESPAIIWEFDDERTRIRPIEIVHALTRSLNKTNKKNDESNTKYLFNLNELSENADFSHWQKSSTIIEPVIELYIDDLYNQELSASRHFLNMIQALETYHSRFLCNGTLADFRIRVEAVIAIRPDVYKESDRKFLLEGSHKGIALRSRLADLLTADFKFHFYTSRIKHRDFPKVIADTRNYYTHYNLRQEEKALKGNDLIEAYHLLRSILEYYILKELGFDEDFIHERTRERIEPLIIRNQIREVNERHKN
ncbi:HEPN domain-containing protein [Paenibacillus sp. FSL R7-0204]|uniref:ApeA N-terminal domain 1-containing protein n=1 Tax=Paenibacillus sp. FSL R7-0204 TaxID=2921675 RepID=UPI0030F6A53E